MDRHRSLDALYSTLRSIARHVRDFRAAAVALLGVALAAGAVLTAAFVIVATAVQAGVTAGFDVRAVEWFARQRTPVMDQVMLEITTLGNGLIVTMVALTASAFLWLARRPRSIYLLLVAVLGGQLINTMLKALFSRPRPDMIEGLAAVRTLSFPSGHAMSAVVAWGGVAYVVSRLEPARALRNATWAFAVLVILAIGISRIYLGVHYPSDVLAGYIGGMAWLAFVAASQRAFPFLLDSSRHGFAPDRGAGSAHDRDTDARAAGQDAGRRRGHR